MPNIPSFGAAGGQPRSFENPGDGGDPQDTDVDTGGMYPIPVPYRGNPEPASGKTGMSLSHPTMRPQNNHKPKKLADPDG